MREGVQKEIKVVPHLAKQVSILLNLCEGKQICSLRAYGHESWDGGFSALFVHCDQKKGPFSSTKWDQIINQREWRAPSSFWSSCTHWVDKSQEWSSVDQVVFRSSLQSHKQAVDGGQGSSSLNPRPWPRIDCERKMMVAWLNAIVNIGLPSWVWGSEVHSLGCHGFGKATIHQDLVWCAFMGCCSPEILGNVIVSGSPNSN